LANPNLNWSSNNTGILSVDNAGKVTARSFGSANIGATAAGNINTSIRLTVFPLGIRIEPAGPITASVGETIQFKATALDVNSQPLPAAPNQWTVSGANGGRINAARIDSNGRFEALGVSRASVRAEFNLPGASLVTNVWETIHVNIVPRRDYRIRPLLTANDVRHSFRLLNARPGEIAVNDSGQIAFVGLLDGIATGLLRYDRGRVDLLAAAGQPSPIGNTNNALIGFTDGPRPPSINNRGQVLTAFNLHPGIPPVIALATGDRVSYPVADGVSQIRRQSLNDEGDFVFLGTFQQAGLNTGALFKHSAGATELIVDQTRPLAGLDPPITIGDFALAGDGTVLFTAASGNTREFGLFRRQGFAAPAKIYAPGDVIDNQRITNIRSPIVFPGGMAFVADLQQGSSLVRVVNGRESRLSFQNVNRVLAGSLRGILFYAQQELYRWFDSAVTRVPLINQSTSTGEPIRDIDSVYETATGEIIAQVRTVENEFVVVKAGNPISTILQAGDPVHVSASPHFQPNRSLLRGPDNSIHLILGSPPSIFQINDSGFFPRIRAGEVPGGGNPNQGSTYSDTAGNLFFTSNGLFRLSPSNIERLFPQNWMTEDGLPAFVNNVLAVSGNGEFVFSANARGQQRFYLYHQGTTTAIYLQNQTPGIDFPNPVIGEMALDDNGRVLATMRASNDRRDGNRLFFYENGSWRALLTPRQDRLAGVLLERIGSVRARGGRYYTDLGFPGGDSSLYEFDGEWRVAIPFGAQTADGGLINGVGNQYDINTRGDIVFLSNHPGFSGIAARIGGTFRHIYSHPNPPPELSHLVSPLEVLIQEDGRIYFTAIDRDGRFGVYVAEPLF